VPRNERLICQWTLKVVATVLILVNAEVWFFSVLLDGDDTRQEDEKQGKECLRDMVKWGSIA